MNRTAVALLGLLYLVAIVAANLTIGAVGPAATAVVAFAMIGPTLTIRDAVQRQLGDGWGSVLALSPLVLAGAAASYALGAPAVALASAVAFVGAELADAVVFTALRRASLDSRVTASNVVGAAVDSIVFPTLAFGALSASLSFGQWTAKVAGGAVWMLLLRRALR